MRSQTITVKHARRMRQALSPPEVALWTRLKGRKLSGIAFRRQHPVVPYILDFHCQAARLAVEVDGYSHGVGDRRRMMSGATPSLLPKTSSRCGSRHPTF